MATPFKPDDKVLMKVKGAEVEGTVRLVWKDEVQVRTSDGVLLWRTVKTVRPLVAMNAKPPHETVAPAAPETRPDQRPVEPTAASPEPTEPISPEKEQATANAIDASVPASEQAESAAGPLPEANSEPELPSSVPAPANFGGRGTADEIVKQKRRRRR